ncbi:MAG: hypothetical protein EXS14_10835 [Planctomycetes bacterium]|nr:hypothetical protein [Planctomycetota bacterium]
MVEFLAARFVPLAMDNGDNPTWAPAEREFLKTLGGDASTEGMSTFTAEGRLLERGGGFEAAKVRSMLGRAAQRFARMQPQLLPPAQVPPPSLSAATPRATAAGVMPTNAAPSSRLSVPEGGLVLMVTWKALIPEGAAEGNPAFGAHAAEFACSLGVDRFWVRSDETAALVRGTLPPSLAARLNRFVIAPLWPALKTVPSLTLQDGALRMEGLGLSGRGRVSLAEGRVQSFELLLSGPAQRVDNFGFPASLAVAPRKGEVPLHVLIELADPALPLSQVPPHAARHSDYLR